MPVPLLDVLGSAQVPAPDSGRLPPRLELPPAPFVGGGQLLPLLREGPAATDPACPDPGVERVVGRLAARECRGPRAVRLLQPGRHFGGRFEPCVGEHLPQFALEPDQVGPVGVAARFVVDRLDARAAVHHRAVEGVEVGLADRVELVVVAAGAGDRHPQERLGDDVDLVLGEADLFVEGVGGAEAVQDEAVLGDADRRLVDAQFRVHPRLVEQVAGQMLADQLVDGYVGVQSPDQVVAVAPGVGHRWVALAAVRLGVADPVHPVPGPAFAEGRVGEQPVDFVRDRGVPVDGGAALEVVDLRRRRRQAGQHVGESPHHGARLGKRRGLEPGVGDAAGEEPVDRVMRPVRGGDVGRFGLGDRLQAPPALPLLQRCLPGRDLPERVGRGRFVPRVGRADLDPALEVGDHVVGQLRSAQGHPEVETRVPHRPQQEAAARLARLDGGAPHAAFEHASAVVQPKSAFRDLRAVVAGVAVLDQDRADLLLEELEILRGEFRRGSRSRAEQ